METINSKIIRSESSKAALLFGLISGGYILITCLLANTSVGGIINYILQIGKIVGCILLMKYCMTKLKSSYEGVEKKELIKYGILIALFSAIITAIVSYCTYKYIFPDIITTAMDSIYASLQSGLDSNSLAIMQSMEQNMPSIQMIGQLVYCFLYGWILSLILAPRVAPNDIFKN